MKSATLVPLMLVLTLVMLTLVPHGASGDDQYVSGTLRVWTDRGTADTLAAFTIYAYSELYVNSTGNITAKPNVGIASFRVYDVDQDLVIKQQSARFYNGSAVLTLVVDPIWTESLLNITVWDFDHALVSSVEMQTEMSHEYQTWLLQQSIYNDFIVHSRAEKAGYDASLTLIGLSLALAFSLSIVIFFWLFLKHDSTLSSKLRAPSYWERIKHRTWPFGLVHNTFGLLVNPKTTWEVGIAKQFTSDRLTALKAQLESDRTLANDEIDEELRRIADGQFA